MAGSKRSKRVSWAPDLKLRQVRLFLSEDAPALSGLGPQDRLQAKGSWLWHSSGMGPDESLPPGFEAPHPIYQPKKEVSQIPLIKWQSLHRFVLNPEWCVADGKESEEVEVQNRRQLGALEAIYPRPSSIPPNPSVSPEAQDFLNDDADTPLIPITPIEDEELDPSCSMPAVDLSLLEQENFLEKISNHRPPPSMSLPNTQPMLQQIQGNSAPVAPNPPSSGKPPLEVVLGAEPDIAAAASAAFTAIMRSSDEGSMIDRELLIKILSDPKMIEQLVSQYGAPKQASTPAVPASAPMPPVQIRPSAPLSIPPAVPSQNVVGSTPLTSKPLPTVAQMASKPVPKPGPMKDVNYYKSLIQQHGDATYGTNSMRRHSIEEQETGPNPLHPLSHHSYHQNVLWENQVDPGVQSLKRKDSNSNPRISRPCVFFNTPRGCKNGASCLFLHDAPSSLPPWTDRKSGKKIKYDRGIAGRN